MDAAVRRAMKAFDLDRVACKFNNRRPDKKRVVVVKVKTQRGRGDGR